ncbi:MAG: 4Fe-4S dicluster domain-containing protein [Proteobacteria bacterium]|nr:4Fe-4S dicluster domain-containing protein [Pseudomonadota bacterium]
MRVVKIGKKNWEEGLNSLRDDFRLYGPVKEDQTASFKQLEESEYPDLSIRNTHLSAKSVVYPQTQKMFAYSLDETSDDHHIMKPVEMDDTTQVLIAARPCDMAAFQIEKRNFDSPEYRDPFWCDAFENTVMIGLACSNPSHTCFCTSTGSGPFNEEGMDILMAEDGSDLLLKSITEKGEALMDRAGWDTPGNPEAFAILGKEAEEKITSSVETDNIEKLPSKELFDAPFWDDLAFACINCGTCTFSCPTCWCFDIQDENTKLSGTRMRNWDSCMSTLFTLEGSGHNPRGIKHQRVRQRFMHKLKYYAEKYNSGIQCVGCGRCIQLCPVNIDIRNVCKTMNDYRP